MAGLRVGFIGAGNMAQALAKGLISAGVTKPSNIIASSPKIAQHCLDAMEKLGCRVTYSNVEVTAGQDVTLIAVKPSVVPEVLADIRAHVTPGGPLIASIAMGVSLKTMEAALAPSSRVVRCMPNTPCLVLEGASVYCRGSAATDEDAKIANRLLSSVGLCHEVPESYLDAVTGLSGSGPAYAFLIVEALADGGVMMGLPRDLAISLAAKTLLGSAKMVLENNVHPGVLKDAVCSPGGCTIAGVYALEAAGLRGALINAVSKATQRARDISNC
uniref:Pyrroline-5-carboxylate reductase n=1 Tax=Hirondellea gigas TaxID=1518452 RepID=A0A6A7FQ26_9CRUS